MEAEAALVWTQGGVELNPISTIDLDLVLIIFPHHTELDHSFGHGHDIEGGFVFGVLLEKGRAFKRVHEFYGWHDMVSTIGQEQFPMGRLDPPL